MIAENFLVGNDRSDKTSDQFSHKKKIEWSQTWVWSSENTLIRINLKNPSEYQECNDRAIIEENLESLRRIKADYQKRKGDRFKRAIADKDKQIKWCEEKLKQLTPKVNDVTSTSDRQKFNPGDQVYWRKAPGELIKAQIKRVFKQKAHIITIDDDLISVNIADLEALEIFLWENNPQSSSSEISHKKKCRDCASCDPCGSSGHYFCLVMGKYFKEDESGCDQFTSKDEPLNLSHKKKSGSLYPFTQNKKDKNGIVKTYPKVIGERDPNNPDHWFWAYCWDEKTDGKWRTKNRSVSRHKLQQIKKAITNEKPVDFILKLL